jgi:tRNA (mo5U34)-methyltransferase
MIDYDALFSELTQCGIGNWRSQLEPLLRQRLSSEAHGDFGKWQQALVQLPEVVERTCDLASAVVCAGEALQDSGTREQLQATLLQLAPWRKGPFSIQGIHIDSEWRSDLKWSRLQSAIDDLAGRTVLDVGCGNGYYAWRMRGCGARFVLGVDPTLLYVMQYLALRHYVGDEPVFVLPLRCDELPPVSRGFDSVFSMGVLYHQRSPFDHLRQLQAVTRSGGQLILETLVLPGEEHSCRVPEGRYARMRNVWFLPTVPELQSWLRRLGFIDVRCVDVTATTTDEQRSTDWMTFESLREALHPDDATLTVEGWPAPLRASIVARVP